jgi:hypothetical protein
MIVYLGTDEAGDRVWRLPDGRWTWGEDPEDARMNPVRMDSESYVSKYGWPVGPGQVRGPDGLPVPAPEA